MRVFKNWKYTVSNVYETPTYDIDDADGNDWYYLSAYLEVRPEKWIIGVDARGNVTWFTDDSVYLRHVPLDGGTVIVTDDFDPSYGYLQTWDGEVFTPHPEKEVRSVEDIEYDINKLMEELKAIKAR